MCKCYKAVNRIYPNINRIYPNINRIYPNIILSSVNSLFLKTSAVEKDYIKFKSRKYSSSAGLMVVLCPWAQLGGKYSSAGLKVV